MPYAGGATTFLPRGGYRPQCVFRFIMAFTVKASTGHANGRGAIPGHFKGAGRDRARPGRADGTGGIEIHIKRGGAIPL